MFRINLLFKCETHHLKLKIIGMSLKKKLNNKYIHEKTRKIKTNFFLRTMLPLKQDFVCSFYLWIKWY